MDLYYLYLLFILFIFGIFIGSFLNVLIDRLSTNRPFVKERSECESCHHLLGPLDLIPLFSFLVLRGRCRYCNAKIPGRLFAIELLTGIVFVAAGLLYLPFTLLLVYSLIVFSIGIVIFFADIQYGIIPNLMVVLLILVSLVYRGYSEPSTLLSTLISALCAFGFFLALFLLTRGRGMGMGDVKLAFAMGLLLGFPGIVIGLYIAFLTGAAISLILIICRKKKLKKDTIPFGPFMVIGALVAFLYGPTLYALIMKVLL